MTIRRHSIQPRPNWEKIVSESGLTFHTFEGKPYWYESAYYDIPNSLVSALYEAAESAHQLCLHVVDEIVANERWAECGLPPDVGEAVCESWRRQKSQYLYGRFDFLLTKSGEIKLLEYNADTPTSLLEATVIQEEWAQAVKSGAKTESGVWEALVEQWKMLIDQGLPQPVLFVCEPFAEDMVTVGALEQTAVQAGLQTDRAFIEDLGWDAKSRQFVGADNLPIPSCFKLYPWEYMLREQFGYSLERNQFSTQWIEPMWKLLLSNKSILAHLYRADPLNPALLPAFFDGPNGMTNYVLKPFFSREGESVVLLLDGQEIREPGAYDDELKIYQAFADSIELDGNYPVFGVWMVGEKACGIGIRESDSRITTNLSRFVPHVVST